MQKEVLNEKLASATLVDAPVTTTWKLDPSHSTAGFAVKHMIITTVRGEFKEFEGTLEWNPLHLEQSKVEVTIKSASITTRDENRDTHLRSADFFEVEKYPELTFRSKKFERVDDEEFRIVGDLTMRGVTKEVTMKVEGPSAELKDPWGGSRIAFTGKTKVNRKDFGLNWNVALEAGGILVSEDVTITIDAQFVKQ
jgi:polyisoprenoid-binding protein YceI